MNNNFISALKELLQIPKRIVIVAHKNPDGDALGSSLAWYHYLTKKNHMVNIIFPNDYPQFLKWLPHQEKVIKYESSQRPKANQIIDKAEVIFTLDFNILNRTGDMEQSLQDSKAIKVMIDHHEHPGDYADYIYSDIEMGSTCQMIYHCIEQLGELSKLNSEIATCLYLGIMTDSGNFQFPRTTPTTHRVIAKLIEYGADNIYIYQQVFNQNSYGKIQLLGFALNQMQILPAYHTVYFSLTRVDLERYNYQKGDTEGIVNFGLSIKDVTFAVIFTESSQEEGIIKISFRSKGNFRANNFAATHFEGGGHINAAGGRSKQSLVETVKRFESLLEEHKCELITK